jgi:hypothetical protein
VHTGSRLPVRVQLLAEGEVLARHPPAADGRDGDQLVLAVRPIATTTPFDHQTTTNFGQSPSGITAGLALRLYE